MIKSIIVQYCQNRSGNFALISAVGAIPLVIGAAVAIDMSHLDNAKSKLRDAAETAAISSARSFKSTDEERRRRARASLDANFDLEEFDAKQMKMKVDLTPSRSTVEAQITIPTKLMSVFGQKQVNVSVNVAAETVFEPACVLINSPNRDSALHFQGHPTLTTDNCYVHNNSNAVLSATARGNPVLQDSEVCLNGGYTGRKWVPGPESECGTKQDPYEDLAEPDVPPCDFKKYSFKSKTPITVKPGHYCGGMKLPANADVRLEPGIYFISDGALDLNANATISGDGVMFFLEGDNAHFELNSGGTWNITPPSDGEYRGITIFQDRDSLPRRRNEITAGGSLDFTGIIYAKTSDLHLHGSPQLNMTGSSTMILTNTLSMQGSPELNLVSVDNPALRPNDRIIGRDAYVRVVH